MGTKAMESVGLKLNIGSGQRPFQQSEGWTNLDCVSRDGQRPDVIADARHIPYPDSSASLCVLHHVVEHFGCGEADGVVKECYRVLRPGGSLLVFVPNMKVLASRWVAGAISDFIFFVNAYGAYQGEEGDRHKWGYTQGGLLKYLEESVRPDNEWCEVKGFNGRAIAGADIAKDWWIATAECVK